MTWYKAYIIGWNGKRKMIAGSYEKKEVFDKAKQLADDVGFIVTVEEEQKTRYGLSVRYYKIYPEEKFTKN